MAELGNANRVYVVAGTGNTYTVMKGEQSNSVNRSAESIDISDKDSGAWGNTMSGKKSLNLDITVYADNKDENQKTLLKAFYKGETIKIFQGKLSDGNAPTEGELFEAEIMNINDTNDAGAVSTRSMSVASKGAPKLYLDGAVVE